MYRIGVEIDPLKAQHVILATERWDSCRMTVHLLRIPQAQKELRPAHSFSNAGWLSKTSMISAGKGSQSGTYFVSRPELEGYRRPKCLSTANEAPPGCQTVQKFRTKACLVLRHLRGTVARPPPQLRHPLLCRPPQAI